MEENESDSDQRASWRPKILGSLWDLERRIWRIKGEWRVTGRKWSDGWVEERAVKAMKNLLFFPREPQILQLQSSLRLRAYIHTTFLPYFLFHLFAIVQFPSVLQESSQRVLMFSMPSFPSSPHIVANFSLQGNTHIHTTWYCHKEGEGENHSATRYDRLIILLPSLP